MRMLFLALVLCGSVAIAGPADKVELRSDEYVSLKEHFESRLSALEEKFLLNFQLNRIALDKAEEKLRESVISSRQDFSEELAGKASAGAT